MMDFRFGFGGILGRGFPVFARFLFVCAVFVAAGFGYRVLAADPSNEEFYGQNQDDINQDQRDEYDGEGDNADEAALPAGGVLSLEAWNEFLSNNNNERPSLPSPPPLRSFTVDDLGVPYATGYAGRVSAEMTVRAPVVSGLTTPAQASFMCDGDGGYFGWSLSAVQGQCLVGGVPVTATRDHFAVDGDLSGMNFSYGQEKKYKVFSDTGDVATSESAVDDIGITGATNDHMFTIMRGKQGFFQYTPEYISNPPAGAPAMTYKTYMLWLDNTSGDDLMIPSGPGETAGGDLIFKDFRQFAQRAPSDLITVERACTPLEVTVCPPPGTPIAGICGSLSATTDRLQVSDTNLDIIRTAADGEACAAGVLDQASVSQNMAMSTDERFVAQWRCNGIDGGDPSVLCTASRVIDDIECPDISRSVTPVTAGAFMMQTDTNNNMYCPLGSGTLEYNYNPIDPATYPNADGSPATQGRYTCSKIVDGRRVETPICTAPLLVPDIIPTCGNACHGVEFKNQGQFQSACGDAATLCAPATGTELMAPVDFVQIPNTAPPEFDVSWTCMPAYGAGSSSDACTATIRPDALSLCGTAMSDNTQVFYTEAQLQASPNLCTNGGTPTAMPTQVGSTNTYEWNCPNEASACSKTLTPDPEPLCVASTALPTVRTYAELENIVQTQADNILCAVGEPVLPAVAPASSEVNVTYNCQKTMLSDGSVHVTNPACSLTLEPLPPLGCAATAPRYDAYALFTASLGDAATLNTLCQNASSISAPTSPPTAAASTFDYTCANDSGETLSCPAILDNAPTCTVPSGPVESYAALTALPVTAVCSTGSTPIFVDNGTTASWMCDTGSRTSSQCSITFSETQPTCSVPSADVADLAALEALPVSDLCSTGSTPRFTDNTTGASWVCEDETNATNVSDSCNVTYVEEGLRCFNVALTTEQVELYRSERIPDSLLCSPGATTRLIKTYSWPSSGYSTGFNCSQNIEGTIEYTEYCQVSWTGEDNSPACATNPPSSLDYDVFVTKLDDTPDLFCANGSTPLASQAREDEYKGYYTCEKDYANGNAMPAAYCNAPLDTASTAPPSCRFITPRSPSYDAFVTRAANEPELYCNSGGTPVLESDPGEVSNVSYECVKDGHDPATGCSIDLYQLAPSCPINPPAIDLGQRNAINGTFSDPVTFVTIYADNYMENSISDYCLDTNSGSYISNVSFDGYTGQWWQVGELPLSYECVTPVDSGPHLRTTCEVDYTIEWISNTSRCGSKDGQRYNNYQHFQAGEGLLCASGMDYEDVIPSADAVSWRCINNTTDIVFCEATFDAPGPQCGDKDGTLFASKFDYQNSDLLGCTVGEERLVEFIDNVDSTVVRYVCELPGATPAQCRADISPESIDLGPPQCGAIDQSTLIDYNRYQFVSNGNSGAYFAYPSVIVGYEPSYNQNHVGENIYKFCQGGALNLIPIDEQQGALLSNASFNYFKTSSNATFNTSSYDPSIPRLSTLSWSCGSQSCSARYYSNIPSGQTIRPECGESFGDTFETVDDFIDAGKYCRLGTPADFEEIGSNMAWKCTSGYSAPEICSAHIREFE